MKKITLLTILMGLFFWFSGCCGDSSSENYEQCTADTSNLGYDLVNFSFQIVVSIGSSSGSTSTSSSSTQTVITSITASYQYIDINLSADNIAPLTSAQSNISLLQASATGTPIPFNIIEISLSHYRLAGFNLTPGNYDLVFLGGAFQTSTQTLQASIYPFTMP